MVAGTLWGEILSEGVHIFNSNAPSGSQDIYET